MSLDTVYRKESLRAAEGEAAVSRRYEATASHRGSKLKGGSHPHWGGSSHPPSAADRGAAASRSDVVAASYRRQQIEGQLHRKQLPQCFSQ